MRVKRDNLHYAKCSVLFFTLIFLNLSACTTLPPLASVAPCEYLNRLVQEATTLTEPRIEALPSNTQITLQEVVECLGEPDYYTAQVWEVQGWAYTLEVFYPNQGIAIEGQADHFVADTFDRNREPLWVIENPQFNSLEDVKPQLLYVDSITITPPVATFEQFHALLVEPSNLRDRDILLTRVFTWHGWEEIEVFNAAEIFTSQ